MYVLFGDKAVARDRGTGTSRRDVRCARIRAPEEERIAPEQSCQVITSCASRSSRAQHNVRVTLYSQVYGKGIEGLQ